MKIYFASHGTTFDNELEISSGWKDAGLSRLGEKQAKKLGERFKNIHLDLICCSDLKRARDTVRIAFGDKITVIADGRLRELNYGDYNGKPTSIVSSMKKKCIQKPFPGGESYKQAISRVQNFVREIQAKYTAQTVLIVGHRATHYGLDTLTGKRTLEECINETFIWQSYWEYEL